MGFGAWDSATLFALNGLAARSAALDAVIVFFATYLPFLVVAAFAWHLYRSRTALAQKVFGFALTLIAALIARIGVGSPIRFFFPRPRPFLAYHLHQLIPEHGPGFPSGHALFFFAFSTVVYAYNRRLGTLSFLASVLICFARVAAGIHYPSDIIAGALIGTFVGLACVQAARHSPRLFGLPVPEP